MRRALHTLKYGRNHGGFGYALAEHAAAFYLSLSWQADIMLPVPLSPKRMQERGYNQVAQVCEPLAGLAGCLYAPQALQRIKHTDTQVGKNRTERKANVQGAFQAKPDLVRGKTVVIMDDVATTGATLVAASSALLEAGSAQVYAYTLARALPHHGYNII